MIPLIIAAVAAAAPIVIKAIQDATANKGNGPAAFVPPAEASNFKTKVEGTDRLQQLGDVDARTNGLFDHSNIDIAARQQDEARGKQWGLLDAYQQSMNGGGPEMEVARQQLEAGLAQSNADASGRARAVGGGGGNVALASRAANHDAAMSAIGANSAAANVRAQSMLAARAGYAGLAGQIRSGDQGEEGLRTSQATASSQSALQQQAQNDARRIAMENIAAGNQRAQLDAKSKATGIAAASADNAANNQSAAQRAEDQRQADAIRASIAAGASGASAVAGQYAAQNAGSTTASNYNPGASGIATAAAYGAAGSTYDPNNPNGKKP